MSFASPPMMPIQKDKTTQIPQINTTKNTERRDEIRDRSIQHGINTNETD